MEGDEVEKLFDFQLSQTPLLCSCSYLLLKRLSSLNMLQRYTMFLERNFIQNYICFPHTYRTSE